MCVLWMCPAFGRVHGHTFVCMCTNVCFDEMYVQVFGYTCV